ncbi:hypothetical protein A2U01_0101772, partial [Trifolium medium]|nr:hypothetical protein [Trifolium medium]
GVCMVVQGLEAGKIAIEVRESRVAAAIARYSASAEEQETVVCFYDFHEMRE